MLGAEPRAQMLDVRSMAEWTFVGLPDLSTLGRKILTVEWQRYPGMACNPDFTKEATTLLENEGADKASPVLCLCRTGGRSQAAAIALTAAGFTKAYNIACGFEGEHDDAQHRGGRTGWKAEGLPWRQG